MQRIGVFVLVTFFGLGFWACAECDPTPNPPRNISVNLYSKETRELIDTTFYTVFAGTSDSVLYTLDTTSSVLLPIDFRDNRVGYIFVEILEGDTVPNTEILLDFENVNRRFDTLILNYRTDLVIQGPDCGFFEAVDSLALEKTTFDSTVIRSTILATDSINVEIYL